MQLNRLIETVFLLLNGNRVTARSLAERFGVSQRTVYRDVEALSAAGIPVVTDRGGGGGIFIDADYRVSSALLKEDERQELAVLLSAERVTATEESRRILEKLAGVFRGARDVVEVDFSDWHNDDTVPRMFEELKRAILANKVVRIRYTDAEGKASERSVEPYKLVFKRADWYLYGACRLRGENRFFKLKRIESLTVTDELCLGSCGESAVARHAEFSGDALEIALRIDRAAGARVYDDFGRSNVTRQENGDYLVRTRVPEERWLLGYLLSYGRYAEVLEPESLRAVLAEELAGALKKYR